MENLKKKFLFLAISIVIISFSVLYLTIKYYPQLINRSLQNIKMAPSKSIFTDSKAGFTIEYPSGWLTEESLELYIQSKGTRFFKSGKPAPYGVHIYYSPWALVEEELVSKQYKIDKNELDKTESHINNLLIITINVPDNVPIHYHSIDYEGGSYIFVARGDEENKIFLEQILPSFTIAQ